MNVLTRFIIGRMANLANERKLDNHKRLLLGGIWQLVRVLCTKKISGSRVIMNVMTLFGLRRMVLVYH